MVKYLKYKKEKLPISVGFYAVSRWQAQTGCTITDLSKIVDNLIWVEPLLFYSLEVGHRMDNKKFKMKQEDIGMMLEIQPNLFTAFLEAMGDFSLGEMEGQNPPLVNEILEKIQE